jgi:hypothetical protein
VDAQRRRRHDDAADLVVLDPTAQYLAAVSAPRC